MQLCLFPFFPSPCHSLFVKHVILVFFFFVGSSIRSSVFPLRGGWLGLVVWEFELLVLAEAKWEFTSYTPNHQTKPPIGGKLRLCPLCCTGIMPLCQTCLFFLPQTGVTSLLLVSKPERTRL